MNAVLYKFINHKKINGTLFYCYEYFSLLKKYDKNLKFIIFDGDNENLEFIKDVFKDKYNILYDDFIIINKYSDLYNLKLNKVITLDVRTYKHLHTFLPNTKIFAYANDTHDFIDNKNSTFYGWYDFQKFHKKTRLKIYKEIHKTYNEKGNKIYITSLSGNNLEIAKNLNLPLDKILLKELIKHNHNLFKNINEIIYWHTGQLDRNNRSLIESQIHNIKLTVYLNGHENDSIKERLDSINSGKINEYFLDENDILIQDYLKD